MKTATRIIIKIIATVIGILAFMSISGIVEYVSTKFENTLPDAMKFIMIVGIIISIVLIGVYVINKNTEQENEE